MIDTTLISAAIKGYEQAAQRAPDLANTARAADMQTEAKKLIEHVYEETDTWNSYLDLAPYPPDFGEIAAGEWTQEDADEQYGKELESYNRKLRTYLEGLPATAETSARTAVELVEKLTATPWIDNFSSDIFDYDYRLAIKQCQTLYNQATNTESRDLQEICRPITPDQPLPEILGQLSQQITDLQTQQTRETLNHLREACFPGLASTTAEQTNSTQTSRRVHQITEQPTHLGHDI